MAKDLIVEDEEQVRVLAESYLREQGHSTLSAATSTEALAALGVADETRSAHGRWDHAGRSDPSVRDQGLLPRVPHRGLRDQFHQFSPVYVHYRRVDFPVHDRHHHPPRRRARAAAIDC